MCAEALSQEEIDALLRGETPPASAQAISDEEQETLQHYCGVVAEAGSEVLSTLLGDTATIELEGFQETDAATVSGEITGDIVAAELHYRGLIQGKTVVVFSIDNALQVALQMTGGGTSEEFGDLEESALSEAIQSMYSAANNQLSQMMGGDIHLDPPEVVTRPDDLGERLPESTEKQILVSYQLKSGPVNGTIYQIIPRNLLESISSAAAPAEEDIEEEMRAADSFKSKAPPIMSAPAQFSPLGQQATGGATRGGLSVDISNLELILDISLEVTVELGRTHRKIRDVLELGPGSVVELDRLAGEPVDILVNDKLFAKGEVVVIDENFGVRITDILSIEERIEALK